MSDVILILNAGSSSLKFSMFREVEPPELLLRGQFESLQNQPRFVIKDADNKVIDQHVWPAGSSIGHLDAIEFLFQWQKRDQFGELKLVAAGHRIVHGGTKFTRPVRINENVLAELQSLVSLAPLHQPLNIAVIRAVLQRAPTLPQIACFDTSFHRTQPAVAQQFALPRELTESGIRRYGFHGLSYEYIKSCLPRIDSKSATGRTIVAHLGNGASLCAMRGGVSIATTMSFTPLDGLAMGTRCGSIDPGVLLYLMDQRGMDARALERLLYHESGLLGVSGISSDMRVLLEHEAGDPGASRAIELFVYRITRELGSLAAALEGLDALIFTGGIGENAPAIRARVCQSIKWLGLDFDDSMNERGGPQISVSASKISAWVVPTNEELMIAQHTQSLLKSVARDLIA